MPHGLTNQTRVHARASAWWSGARRQTIPRAVLLPHRYPDFEPAIAGGRIEILVVALKTRRVGGLHARRRQPMIPYRVDGAADGRDMLSVGEHGVFLFGNPHAGELARQVGE